MKPIALASVFVLIVLLIAGALMSAGCVSGNGGAATQPVVLDPGAVQLFAEIALDDALLYLSMNPKLRAYVDAVHAAQDKLSSAVPGTPQYATALRALNAAATTLFLEVGQSKVKKAAAARPSH